jgi:hypothetical protein
LKKDVFLHLLEEEEETFEMLFEEFLIFYKKEIGLIYLVEFQD